ncbi:MAG: condensation domain-containing protein [Tumebacillaceae bacterium]
MNTAANEALHQSNNSQETEPEVFVIPASFAQQRLWFFDQFESGSVAYNIPTVYQFQGTLDVTLLAQCLQEIVQRHETLRTTFTTENEQPMQVIHSEMHLPLPLIDLSERTEMDRNTELQNFVHQEAHTPFDLTTGPLIRTHLLRLSDEAHALVVNMHHIISDGWSLGVFIRELAALYAAFASDTECELPELPLQYADYSLWQQEWLQGEVLEEQLAYWREKLGGTLPVLQLPTDRPRPEVQTFKGLTRKLMLSRELSDRVHQLCQSEGVTLYMALLTAFKTLMHRYTGLEDVIVGSPIAGRNQEEIENLIGFFVNTLVLRTDLSGQPSYRELLSRVREVSLGAYGHQDVPFEKLVEELQPERSTGISPLFQVVFALSNDQVGTIACGDLMVEQILIDHNTAKFDLTLGVTDTAEGLELTWNWNTDLFAESSILRLGQHFAQLLESITAHPEWPIAQFDLVTKQEQEQLLFGGVEQKADFLKRQYELTEAWVEGSLAERIHVYLLDAHLQPVPVGVPGDVYLSAIGLQMGVEGQLANPFVPNEMMYKTGERGFFRADGSIALVEEEAQQVKRAKRKRPHLPNGYVAPTSMVEEVLTDIWEEVLGVEQVGVQDDFSLLGGHLLLAPQVLARVQKTLDVQLPPNALFEAKTIATLAERVEANMLINVRELIAQ